MEKETIIRPMRHSELAFAVYCTAKEGWIYETLSAFESFYRYDPKSCRIATVEGKRAGICMATLYGEAGFIGDLIVLANFRGQGVGAALLNNGVEYLKAKGARTIYLDGVPQAVPLYERNGFHRICTSLRLFRAMEGMKHTNVRPMTSEDFPAVFELDRRAFGADRSYFLACRQQYYPNLAKVLVEGDEVRGFVMGRSKEGWASAGPWIVHPEAQNPMALLESLAAEISGIQLTVGVLESNQKAVNILKSNGFIEWPDPPTRMANGPDSDLGASEMCFAVGGAAKG